MLRDVTAALRRATGKAASPEACAMLREALDGLDDALENHELAHTVGPLLDEAKTALASDEPTEEESQECAERLASYAASDLVNWSFDSIDNWSTLGGRVRDFAPTIETAIVHLAPHHIPQMQLRETRERGVDFVEIVWPGKFHELVIALHADRGRDAWCLETSITHTVVEEGPLATLNLPLALLAVVHGSAAPCSLEGRGREVLMALDSGWVKPDGCTVLKGGYYTRCVLTPSAFEVCANDRLVTAMEDVSDVAVDEPIDAADCAVRAFNYVSSLKTRIPTLRNDSVRAQAMALIASILLASVGIAPHLSPIAVRESDDGSATIEWSRPTRRFAITLETNPQESGWHFVSLPPTDTLESGPLATLDLPLALLATIEAPPLRWSPFLLRVAPEWVPPDGCRVTSRLGDIVGCSLTPSALAACEADPAVLIAEESTGECHNGTEEA